jgi:hypothetical protein
VRWPPRTRRDAPVSSALVGHVQVIKPTGDTLSLRRAISFFITNLSRQAERQETIAAIGEDLFTASVMWPMHRCP